MFYRSYST